MNKKLKQYIDYYMTPKDKFSFGSMFKSKIANGSSKKSIQRQEVLCDEEIDVHNFININKDENNFQRLLFKYIDERNLKDSDVYNKVHIDRRLFSKIRSDINYHPSKETVILLGLSLELNEKEMDELLSSASYSLPKNNYYDLIIRFCFIEGIYKITEVNKLLESYNCKLFNY